MKIKEKIQISAIQNQFTLFAEGTYNKCNNEDTMLYYTSIRTFKIQSQYLLNNYFSFCLGIFSKFDHIKAKCQF
jgi:hypothetical protein